jgi:hypothetical protein
MLKSDGRMGYTYLCLLSHLRFNIDDQVSLMHQQLRTERAAAVGAVIPKLNPYRRYACTAVVATRMLMAEQTWGKIAAVPLIDFEAVTLVVHAD